MARAAPDPIAWMPCQFRPYFSSRSSTTSPSSCFSTSKSTRPSVNPSGTSASKASTFDPTRSVLFVSGLFTSIGFIVLLSQTHFHASHLGFDSLDRQIQLHLAIHLDRKSVV